MSEYHFLCPKCGHAWLEGTGFTHCPKCQVPLLETSPAHTAELREVPDHLDVDARMREALAARQDSEEIDPALERVIKDRYPKAHEGLFRLLCTQLDQWQRLRGVTRLEAAKQFAKAHSELTKRPDGTHAVETVFQSETRWMGLEKLPAEQQEMVKQKIQEAMASGKPLSKIEITLPSKFTKTGCSSVLEFLAGVVITVWIWLQL
jgi:uncharacterized Zn finger protein (UPF0148 family)